MNINTLSILTQNAMPAAGVAIADIVKYVSGRVDQGRSLLIDYLKMNDEQHWQITAIAHVGNANP